jgi:hypothetical protein
MKRGQASAFIIMGLIILVIIVLFFLNSFNINPSDELTEIKNIDQAQEAIENCIEETTEEAFYTQGLQGGVFKLTNYSPTFTTVYNLLTIEEIESNIEEYLNTNILDCSHLLKDTEFTIQEANIQTTASFQKEVEIEVSWPVIIINEEKQQMVSEIQTTFDLDFTSLYNTISLYYENEGFPLQPNDYIVNIFPTEDYSEVLIEITDTEYKFRIVKQYL